MPKNTTVEDPEGEMLRAALAMVREHEGTLDRTIDAVIKLHDVWTVFIAVRARVLIELRDEHGLTSEQICTVMGMVPVQVESIQRWREQRDERLSAR